MMRQHRVESATEAFDHPTDWESLGARIIETAALACACHLQSQAHAWDQEVPLGRDLLVPPETWEGLQ